MIAENSRLLLPTIDIVDERVLREFYFTMVREAERQGIHPSIFPVIGDLGLGELIDGLKDGTNMAMQYYQRIVIISGFSLPKNFEYVDTAVDQRVVDSYKNWLKEIGEDRAYRKLHKLTMDELVKLHTQDADNWRRADDLTKRRYELSGNELRELKLLETRLDSDVYTSLRERVKTGLIESELEKVYGNYKIPVEGINFAEAFREIDCGSSIGTMIYGRLVSIHKGFKFKRAA
ncbi:hypothetical protein J4216_00055 [Candidatus Woesearchaeota archaeon]|nr:hypothetical protein [Candidatus Woesearchaeota archaeon]